MNAVKRACLYLARKKGKTVSLLAFLLAIATMILVCLSIYSAADTSISNIKKSLMGYFTVNAKHLDGGLDGETIGRILEIEGLSGAYGLRSYTEANYYNSGGEPLEADTEGAYVLEGYEKAGTIIGTDNSAENEDFASGKFELTQGEAIADGQENAALIHKDFAEKNHLSVGDTIRLEDVETGNIVWLSVAGIFQSNEEQDRSVNYSYTLYQNTVFVNMDACSALLFGETGLCQYGDFYVDDPDELDSIIEQVKEIPGVDWDSCIITKYDTDYLNAREPLDSLQNIVFVAVILITAIAFIVLSLLLLFRSHGRVHEMGVLLAAGIPRKDILLQQLAEVLIIAVLALLLSFASTSIIAGQIGDRLLSQAEAKEYETVKLTDSDEGAENPDTAQAEARLAQIDVSVSMTDYILVWGIGLLLCTASTSIAVIPVFRMKPKNILSQMS